MFELHAYIEILTAGFLLLIAERSKYFYRIGQEREFFYMSIGFYACMFFKIYHAISSIGKTDNWLVFTWSIGQLCLMATFFFITFTPRPIGYIRIWIFIFLSIMLGSSFIDADMIVNQTITRPFDLLICLLWVMILGIWVKHKKGSSKFKYAIESTILIHIIAAGIICISDPYDVIFFIGHMLNLLSLIPILYYFNAHTPKLMRR